MADKEKTDKEKKEVPAISPVIFTGIDGNTSYSTFKEYYAWATDKIEVGYDMGDDDICKFEYEKKTNAQRIVEKYTPQEKVKYKDEISKNKPPIVKVGTTLYFPNSSITVEIQRIMGSDTFLSQGKFKTFWSAQQKKIFEDKGYVPFDNISADRNNINLKSLNLRVWIYVKAFDKIYDISGYVSHCETGKDFGTGNFSIEVLPTLELEKLECLNDFQNQFSVSNNEGYLNKDWFSSYIQNNDLIFIRYEVLKMEPILKIGGDGCEVPFSALTKDLVWDMMGLVDNVTLAYSSSANDYTVNIVGKDYTKLLTEDGSYFIPLKYVEGSPDGWFYGGNEDTEWYKRNVITGAFDTYMAYDFQKIDTVLWFVLNQLSNIGLVSDSLFSACAVRTEKFAIETLDGAYKSGTDSVKGIWRVIRVMMDDMLQSRRIVDRSLINPEGTLLDFFNKVCQQPFVEFWGDTWGAEFDLIIRQPPFTKSAMLDILDSGTYITIEPQNVYSLNLAYDERVYAWYRIMPQNDFMGSSQYASLAFVPIVYLDEYCRRFGNKRCIINDIYLSLNSLRGKMATKDLNTMSQALLNDLLFAVETNSYLPFTRKGTITINGDRRIRVGTFIKLNSTDELFYVISVNNSIDFSRGGVDRVTTLTVERGMRPHLMRSNYNYFNLVNIEGIRQDVSRRNEELRNSQGKNASDTVNDFSSTFAVNTEVFNYFVERQFEKQVSIDDVLKFFNK